jgi:uncharacterized protein (TIGR02145 family)
MKRKIFLSFGLLLTVSMATVVFNSCGGDKDEPKKETPVTSISLDSTSLALTIGEDYTLTATVLPANATNKTVTWQTNNAAIATVANGVVTAVAAGTATITAKAGDKTATCTTTITGVPEVPADGVLINGVTWATRNVDEVGTFATTPESYGKFYQWNRKTAWAATGTITGWDNSTPTGTIWEKANDPSPAGWRVPTHEEQEKLLDTEKVTNEWTTQNGVSGRKFTDKTTSNSHFLPAAGSRNPSSSMYGAGTNGYYWSSTPASTYSYSLYFSDNDVNLGGQYSAASGLSVRCVAE